jgi:hypothetical protein
MDGEEDAVLPDPTEVEIRFVRFFLYFIVLVETSVMIAESVNGRSPGILRL